MSVSTTHVLKRNRPGLRRDVQKAESSFLRRIIAAEDDPARRRIHTWLAEIDDERLFSLGLTPKDIAILRGTRTRRHAR